MRRRVYTVTGQQPDEVEVDKLVETGGSETVFQQAIQDHGRGQVSKLLS